MIICVCGIHVSDCLHAVLSTCSCCFSIWDQCYLLKQSHYDNAIARAQCNEMSRYGWEGLGGWGGWVANGSRVSL